MPTYMDFELVYLELIFLTSAYMAFNINKINYH